MSPAPHPAGPGENGGALVRPYGLTGGRTRPAHTLRLESLIRSGGRPPAGQIPPEHEHAVRLCRQADRSVAEIAALLGLPALVTKVIVSDLVGSGALGVAVPALADPSDPQLLEALLAGMHSKFALAGHG
ncbi:DUF742 domain-containing protein [Streptomyces uncialis]|uniref:DUF742 domain-containing protein n=1 Tax=Streptomyces uncialis TaxID=1048205 RepID=UPI00380AD899